MLRFIRDEEGLTVVEYAVAGGLISLAVVGGFTALGGEVNNVIQALITAIPGGS
ncbi:Flp/Fap pilin component [compost metagenome]